MIERLNSALFHDLRAFDFEAQVVYRIRQSGDVGFARPDRLYVDVPLPGERFSHVHHTLDIQQFFYKLGPLGRRRGGDEQHFEREIGRLVVD